ncbi:MAG: hypothetical protein A2Z72_00575 [Omnitrophica bacterium RBG_13_46_9]|nr:MAG: hypothetical protein A2Z72_00575 [Omnitrophica bacterium RBG_13_46_9]
MLDFSKILKNIPTIELDKAKKRILLIYASALLLTVVLYFILFLRPTLAKLFEIIPELKELRQNIKVVRDDLRFEEKLKTRLEGLQEVLGEYENKLSREKELPKFLENLSKMARSSGVKILGITPLIRTEKQKSGAGDIYQEVPIIIGAQSGYHEFGAFINRLENDPRYMQISDIKMQASRNNPRRHEIEFVVYAYTFKKESQNE